MVWQDTDLNILLTLGLQELAKILKGIDPDRFIAVYRCDIVSGATFAGLNYYSWPDGYAFEHELAMLDASTGKYLPVDLKSFGFIRRRGANETTVYYAHYGSGFILSPTPTVAVSQGLQLSFSPTLTISDDAQQPPTSFPGELHMAWVIRSEALAYGDTGEAADVALKEVDRMVAEGKVYLMSATSPSEIIVDVPKDYGE